MSSVSLSSSALASIAPTSPTATRVLSPQGIAPPQPLLPSQWSARMSGLSWALLNPHIPDGDVVDKFCADENEHFIMKADMQIVTGEGMQQVVKNRTVMLTEENWIEMKMQEPVDPAILPSPTSPASLVVDSHKKKHKPLEDIHSVEPLSSGFGKVKRLLQVGSTFDDFLKSKVVRCHSKEECEQWLTVFQVILRNHWQRHFEATILPEPEVYKRHAFVIKDHKDRLIVMSDFWSASRAHDNAIGMRAVMFYNIEVSYKPTTVKGTKWTIPVSSFLSALQVRGELAILRITFDTNEARKQRDAHHRSKEKGELRGDKGHEFQFRSESERQRFVSSIEAVHWQITRKRLHTAFVEK